MRILVIIPAAGTGSRFGSELPKQFQQLAGKPVLQRVVERFLFHEDVIRVVVPVSQALLDSVSQQPGDRVQFVRGGDTRQRSVFQGFQAAADETFDMVAVHDAVRPFFADATFRAVLNAAEESGAALPAVPVADTIHTLRGDLIDLTLDRSTLVAAQTPQCFRYDVFRDVVTRAERDGEEGTDDAGLAARYGIPVKIVPGDSINFKITKPDDLALAETILARWA